MTSVMYGALLRARFARRRHGRLLVSLRYAGSEDRSGWCAHCRAPDTHNVASDVVYCRRCGATDLDDPRFCYRCSDGEADTARAEELVVAATNGTRNAIRVLADTTDPRAFEVIVRAATNRSTEVRRAALTALGGIGDARGIDAAQANLEDADEGVRHAAIGALAEMGPGGADAIATRLADPADRTEAARALAWLRDDRALEPLALIVDSDDVLGEAIFRRSTMFALCWLGGADAIDVLERAATRVAAARDDGVLDWQVKTAAATIGETLLRMRTPASDAAFRRVEAQLGPLHVLPIDPPPPFRAPPHPRRTVPRRSFELRPVDEPISSPVTKFGGQPVWIGEPTWPLRADGGPATFIAQFELPDGDGLAYLFLDASAQFPDPPAVLFAQPGVPPESVIAVATGPTYAREVRGAPRYATRMVFRQIESLAVLEPGFDFDDWDGFPDDPAAERDDHRDWNKLGGTPRWLQGAEEPTGPGWRFLFQFTAASVGHEMADGAEVYGHVNEDGRGAVAVQSH
jgi:hypothetical protein